MRLLGLGICHRAPSLSYIILAWFSSGGRLPGLFLSPSTFFPRYSNPRIPVSVNDGPIDATYLHDTNCSGMNLGRSSYAQAN